MKLCSGFPKKSDRKKINLIRKGIVIIERKKIIDKLINHDSQLAKQRTSLLQMNDSFQFFVFCFSNFFFLLNLV